MTNSTIPSIISSVLLAMIAYKVYSNDESKKEHYVNFPSGLKPKPDNGKKITMEVAERDILASSSVKQKVPEMPVVPENELPVTDGGEKPPVYIVNRALHNSHAALQSRQLEAADPIRGDLQNITPNPTGPDSLLGYTTLNRRGIHKGILGFGVNDAVQKPESYLSVRQ